MVCKTTPSTQNTTSEKPVNDQYTKHNVTGCWIVTV